MIFAPWPSRLSAHALAFAGLLFCVSQVMIFSCTPPRALTCFTRYLEPQPGRDRRRATCCPCCRSPADPTCLPAAVAVPVTVDADERRDRGEERSEHSLLFTFTNLLCVAFTTGSESRIRLLFRLDEPAERRVEGASTPWRSASRTSAPVIRSTSVLLRAWTSSSIDG